MGSLSKKTKSLFRDGLDPLVEGKYNYELNDPEIEALARERVKDCGGPNGCLVREPISFLRVADERIPELNNKMCDECGCAGAYLFRQNVKICHKWKK